MFNAFFLFYYFVIYVKLFVNIQKLLKEGGKSALTELKLAGNTEELKAKEFASVVQKLQVAIKREQQIKVLKQVNEKQKQVRLETLYLIDSNL